MTNPVDVVNGLAAAGNLVNALIGLAQTAGNKQALIDAHNAIISAQAGVLSLQKEHSALLKEKDDLEKELADLKLWPSEREKYEPVEIVPGVFAFTKKLSEGGISSKMYFCANCLERGEKTILNRRNVSQGRQSFLDCPHCKSILMIEGPGI